MNRSYIADSIMNEYYRQKYYVKRKREKCKDKKCTECKFIDICIEGEKDGRERN